MRTEQTENVSSQPEYINYRNCVYQGILTKPEQLRNGIGLIYLPQTLGFIGAHFCEDQINGKAIFFGGDASYMYGEWSNNVPHGLNVLRIGEVIVMVEYEFGSILEDRPFLVLEEKYNIGLILKLVRHRPNSAGSLSNSDVISSDPVEYSLLEKRQIYCSDHFEALIASCHFENSNLASFQTLLRFINEHFASEETLAPVKLRLINETYYRFGYDEGIAIIFDDSFRRISIGIHHQTHLCSLGVKFVHEPLNSLVEEGIFDSSQNTILSSSQESRPFQKIGKLYSIHHLQGINFQNSFYLDPSQTFINYFKDIFESKLFRPFYSGMITTRKNEESFHDQKRITEESRFKDSSLEALIKNEMQNQLQALSEKDRLQLIKKEVYDSLKHKKLQTNKPKDSKQYFELESPQKFNEERENAQYQQFEYRIQSNSREVTEKKSANEKSQLDFYQVLNQKLLFTQEKPKSKSKPKRKIFQQQNVSIPRNYSPEPSVSPFKSRMRAKIFSEYSPNLKLSKSSLKEKRNEKSSEKFILQSQARLNKTNVGEIRVQAIKQNEKAFQYNSPYEQINFSRNNFLVDSNALVSAEKKHQISNPAKTETQKTNNYQIQFNQQQDTHQPLHQETSHLKNRNQVYRHTINGAGYSDYYYQPINAIKPSNQPYLNSNLKNKVNQKNKKIIVETSPVKEKMQKYKNYQNFEKRQ